MKLATIGGVALTLHPGWILVMAALAFTGLLPSTIVLLLSLLLHEWMHVLMARACGIQVSEVELFPFGGVARLESWGTMTAADECRVAIAGPAFNLLCAMALAFYDYWYPLSALPIDWMIQCNASLCLMNLIPAFPLDGGRVLRALLAGRIGMTRATRIASISGCVFASLMIAGGTAAYFFLNVNPSIAVTAVFVLLRAARELRTSPWQAGKDAVHKRVTLVRGRSLPVRFTAVSGKTRMRELIRFLRQQQYGVLLIVDADMRPLGILSETDILRAQEKGDLTAESYLKSMPKRASLTDAV